jgi:hypothetical protein
MRNIGLVSAAVIAMAAMAETVAASAPPVIQSRPPIEAGLSRLNAYELARLMDRILFAVGEAEGAGQSGEPAQQSIKLSLQQFIDGDAVAPDGDVVPRLPPAQVSIALITARRALVDNNQLRRGSDGDLAVSALLAAREAEEHAERSRPGRNFGGSLTGQGGVRPGTRPSCYMRGLPDGCDAPRNVPGNATTGQAATNAGTTEIRRSRATYDSDLDDEYDPDLDDEAGEPD